MLKVEWRLCCREPSTSHIAPRTWSLWFLYLLLSGSCTGSLETLVQERVPACEEVLHVCSVKSRNNVNCDAAGWQGKFDPHRLPSDGLCGAWKCTGTFWKGHRLHYQVRWAGCVNLTVMETVCKKWNKLSGVCSDSASYLLFVFFSKSRTLNLVDAILQIFQEKDWLHSGRWCGRSFCAACFWGADHLYATLPECESHIVIQ